ncbi:hypothetical protein KC19_6G097100 [Ceratodon purpureus]|uniref:Uncharacterized protein n=1 Tax=Ceratodon purpureus TaxID=3225 RepID=A0A8T0HFX0_CERPU|nr:hypothetical protein KC19_6G097100 [Ceratodon purpureus]
MSIVSFNSLSMLLLCLDVIHFGITSWNEMLEIRYLKNLCSTERPTSIHMQTLIS